MMYQSQSTQTFTISFWSIFSGFVFRLFCGFSTFYFNLFSRTPNRTLLPKSPLSRLTSKNWSKSRTAWPAQLPAGPSKNWSAPSSSWCPPSTPSKTNLIEDNCPTSSRPSSSTKASLRRNKIPTFFNRKK